VWHFGSWNLRGWRRVGFCVAVAVIGGSLSACAMLGLDGGQQPAADAAAEDEPVKVDAEGRPGIAYEASIQGVSDQSLLDLLRQTSQLVTLQARPPATLGGLRRRAESDLERLQTALRSEGYYAATVRYELDQAAEPAKVTVDVLPGQRYVLTAYVIRYDGSPPPPADRQPGVEELGLKPGEAARAPTIVAAQRMLLDILGRRGYPLAKVLDRRSVIDRAAASMTVTLSVDAGPRARFGTVAVDGLRDVDEDYVRRLLTWTEDEPFDAGEVESSRQALAATGLFSSIVITPGSEVDGGGKLPITVAVSEARHRSIGFGAKYSTSEGVGGSAFWEHRNLLGENEQLRLALTAAEIEQVFDASIRKPNFLRAGQAIFANTQVANRNTEAFDEQSVSGLVGVERSWGQFWRASAGVSGEYNILEDNEGEKKFRLVGLPLAGTRDTSDDLLNPTRGTKLRLSLTPYVGGGDEHLQFAKATADGAAYYAIDSAKRFVLAGRVKIGSLWGADTERVPANKRYYAGGGGSIRGFEFQSVGPLDSNNDPLGGRSLLEVNAEMRIKITESFGIVPFVDGGSVFDSTYPDFEEPTRWAGGLGFRYFTGIGPLRLDFALPINGRSGIDDRFEFYISLGQAF